jgi:hypothetical protein
MVSAINIPKDIPDSTTPMKLPVLLFLINKGATQDNISNAQAIDNISWCFSNLK